MKKNHPAKIFDYSYITDGIYIGTNQCCQMHFDKMLLKKGVSFDISLEKEHVDAPYGVESYIWIPIKDHQTPTWHQLEFGVAAIEKIVAMGKKAYVHCKNGHGRSPLLLAAYLIKKGAAVKSALAIIKQKRPSMHLRATQKKMLKDYFNRQ